MARWVIIKFVALPMCVKENFVTARRLVIIEMKRALKCKPSTIRRKSLFNVNACLGNENALLTIM